MQERRRRGEKWKGNTLVAYVTLVLFVIIRCPSVSFWSPGLMFLSQILRFSDGTNPVNGVVRRTKFLWSWSRRPEFNFAA